MDGVNIVIGGIAVMPLIVALIEWLKARGMDVQYAPWICGIGAVVAYVVANILIPQYPQLAIYAQWVVECLSIFLAATVGYQVLVKPSKAAKVKN